MMAIRGRASKNPVLYPGIAIAILSRFILRASKNVTERRKYGNCCFKL